MRFLNKKVLVTGAARGIGAATAVAFAQEGADVCINDLLPADETLARIEGLGRKGHFVRADVADPDAVDAMVEEAARLFGRLDVLVANAAFSERGPFWEISREGFRRTIEVTMMGPYHCLLSATRRMREQGGGAIVIVGSPHADHAFPDAMPYNMAKAAVTHMARTAACELFPHKIRVNVIHPGWTDTPGERKFKSDEELAKIGAATPPGRLARPDEIARGILFLADDASVYVNGTTLSIDGGLNLPWVRWDEKL